jgi:hypothetical protein
MGEYSCTFRGRVHDNNDPQQLSRLLVEVPDVAPSTSMWAGTGARRRDASRGR